MKIKKIQTIVLTALILFAALLAALFAVGAAEGRMPAAAAEETQIVALAEETAGETAGETAAPAAEDGAAVDGWKALAAGIAIGVASGAGALAMGIAIAKAGDGIARQPEADGKIRSTLMLGLILIETAIIYALIIAILIIFAL